ncbi:MAG TPA: NAD-dependent epimerase/dehydratase family protein [Turneriella sp.]|nr:NAD-dependent epimerase/dehydratase family protein [Turneriella sp.]HNL09308.1 NAD-dependent epimerase/dehydratase family protein [Turneriella sp.]HNL53185.1 NAD-dependent epimerase/dehydratase family protein [Turneriella sp.]HNN00259.1 NAD-dependent epimerase/dehydratase family protein [Turneriella sp.]
MRIILITGSTGFIGSHLADACLKKKYRVRALVMRGDPGEVGLKKQRVEIVYGDLRDGPSLEAACKGVDIVFHCAAVVTDWAPRSLFQAVNIDGMEKLCRAALNARVQRFVELSTNDVFGLDESRVITEEAPLKKWGEPYADTKIAAEEIAWRYYQAHGLPVTTFQQFCAAIAAALGAKAPRLHLPYFVAYGAALLMEFTWRILRLRSRPLLTTYTVKNLGSRLRFSIERAERELGWTPKISYREGLARTLEWLKGLDRSNLKQK